MRSLLLPFVAFGVERMQCFPPAHSGHLCAALGSAQFNPDLDMVSCTRCDEWYHLRCLKEDWQWDGVDRSIFRGSFACKRCKRDGRAP